MVGSTEHGVQHDKVGDRNPTFDVILAILDTVYANYLFGRIDAPVMHEIYVSISRVHMGAKDKK